MRRKLFWLAVSGVSLYLVAPSVIDAFGSLAPDRAAVTRLARGDGGAPGRRRSAASWILQWVAMRGSRWQPVIASQLAGNALAKIAPGGGAMESALQYRMLVAAGLPPAAHRVRADGGEPARVRASCSRCRVLAIPAILRGGVQHDLAQRGRGRPRRVRGAVRGRRRVASRPIGRCCGSAASSQPRPQPAAPPRRAARPAAAAAHRRARPDHRHARPALEARARGRARALVVRLRLPARRAEGARRAPAPRARAACVLRGAAARADPADAGRPRLRRGRPDRRRSRWRACRRATAVVATFAYRLFSYWLQLPFGLLGLGPQRPADPDRRAGRRRLSRPGPSGRSAGRSRSRRARSRSAPRSGTPEGRRPGGSR